MEAHFVISEIWKYIHLPANNKYKYFIGNTFSLCIFRLGFGLFSVSVSGCLPLAK